MITYIVMHVKNKVVIIVLNIFQLKLLKMDVIDYLMRKRVSHNFRIMCKMY